MIRRSGTEVRRQVFERDRGVCAGCGLDCEKLRRELRLLCFGNRKQPADREAWRRRRSELIEQGFDMHHRRHHWDADHVVPVVEGGGACGLENYRTLCQVCHKAETAALARRRSRK